jgi:hypothetical protein
MYNAMDLTIQDVLALLPAKNAGDLRKAFLPEELVTRVVDYLELVVEEPAAWLQGLPATWKSVTNFEHVRAAVTAVTKLEAVAAAYPAVVSDFADMMKSGRLGRDVLVAEVARRTTRVADPAVENCTAVGGGPTCRSLVDRLKAACLKVSASQENAAVHALLSELWTDTDEYDSAVFEVARYVFKDVAEVLEPFLQIANARPGQGL